MRMVLPHLPHVRDAVSLLEPAFNFAPVSPGGLARANHACARLCGMAAKSMPLKPEIGALLIKKIFAPDWRKELLSDRLATDMLNARHSE
jgi:hypothetical protein